MKDFFQTLSEKFCLNFDEINKEYELYLDNKIEFKYERWFTYNTDFGDAIVEPFINDFFGLKESNNKEYDSSKIIDSINYKFEIKAFRCIQKKSASSSSYSERALTLPEWKALKNSKKNAGSFQQIKPHLFDFLIGAVVGKDNIEILLIPSKEFSFKENVGIKLSGQHRGNQYEGQTSYNKTKDYAIGTIEDLTEQIFINKIREYRRGC